MLETKLLGFECIKELYIEDDDFKEIYELCTNLAKEGFFRHKVREAHDGALMDHFWEVKTYETLVEHFYWLHMRRDAHHVCERCLVCKGEKSKVSSHGLYTPLYIPTFPWVHISMNFVLRLPKSNGGRDSISLVVDKFFKMTHFIPCHKVDYTCHVTNLFFREVVRLLGLSKTSKLGTKLLFFTTCHPLTDGQTEMVNRTLSQLLRCFVKKSLRSKEEWLPHIEFSYNRLVNNTISHSPFELVYGFKPLTTLDLFPLLDVTSRLNEDGLFKAQFVKKLYERARSHIEKKVYQYAKQVHRGRKEKVFENEDLVWVHLRKKRFPSLRKSNLNLGMDTH
ncbi:hypothetical protein CR513_01692, partial [Mucuna pruriens]